ncbi:MAG: signal peptide protein [Nitrospira sp.]|nr:signal peptide protein [Nitrospira sp.]
MRGPIHTTLISTALGISLLAIPSLYAGHRDDLANKPLTNSERAQLPSNNLSGGFYEDGHKADDWFYDYYESSGATRMNDRISSRSASPPLADAAIPSDESRFASRTSDRGISFQQYYDEPWFYDERDPAYFMPATRAREDAFSSAGRDGELIEGSIDAVKQVRNRNSGGQNTVVLMRKADGSPVISDLGPTQDTLDLALTEGVTASIKGQREDVGPFSVLMANNIRAGVKRVTLDRGYGTQAVDNRQVEGSIEHFRAIPVRQTGQTHQTAAVRTADGRMALVDFGPNTADNILANAAPGDRIVATGPVVQIGNYPVMFANRLSMNGGIPVRVARPDGEYVPPAGRHITTAQQEFVNPSCVGGGCEGNTINPSLARDAHSNAMDGTVRSERR